MFGSKRDTALAQRTNCSCYVIPSSLELSNLTVTSGFN
jgi:hypothetical protein